MKQGNWRKKLEYFWMYYKIPFLAVLGVCVMIVYFGYAKITEKEYAFNAILLDIHTNAQEEMLEDMAEMYFYQNVELPQGDIQSLLDQLAQVDSEKYEQENQERQLKLQYRNGEISREDFISGMKESIRQEEELDVREELLEDSLERLGWDD